MNLSNKLKYYRSKKSLTQSQVAKKLCVSRKTISGWENARSFPDLNTLVKISNIYNVSIDTLLKENSLSDTNFSQRNQIEMKKKISMMLYYINILLCISVNLNIFTVMRHSSSLVSIFLIINTIVFFYYFPSWIGFKSKIYKLLLSATFILTLSFILNEIFGSSDYMFNSDALTKFGFLIGRLVKALISTISIIIIVFFNPSKLL